MNEGERAGMVSRKYSECIIDCNENLVRPIYDTSAMAEHFRLEDDIGDAIWSKFASMHNGLQNIDK